MSPDCSNRVQIGGLWRNSLVDQIDQGPQGPKGTESEISNMAAGAITASSWNRLHCRYSAKYKSEDGGLGFDRIVEIHHRRFFLFFWGSNDTLYGRSALGHWRAGHDDSLRSYKVTFFVPIHLNDLISARFRGNLGICKCART